MKWLLVIVAVVVLVTLALLILGLVQPVKHSVTRSILLKQNPGAVFALLDNRMDMPKWSSGVAKVDRLPDQDGKSKVRCQLAWGGMQMIMTQIERTPTSRLVIEMSKDGGAVLGTWTYTIEPETDGCRVALTEAGELKNPFFRAFARLRGLDANITQILRDLAKHFGETAEISPG
jgi:hypothetical protein